MKEVAPMATPKPPRNLGDRGRELWDSVIPTYQLKADEIQILIDACREADLIERLHDALVNGDLISSGYNGQDVPAPTLSEIRQHRALLNTLLKALKLPESAASAARKKAETSEKARLAVRARWGSGASA
jgi:hypothetical protein